VVVADAAASLRWSKAPIMTLHQEPSLQTSDEEGQYPRFLSSMKGAEHCAVGLSPSFWSHVPLFVAQLHNLVVVDGILCFDNTPRDEGGKLVPVTKCVLVGVVVAVDARYESTAYVLDDGTGLVDCIHWTDHAAMLLTDAFAGATVSGSCCPTYGLGELIRVYGRIVHCYSLLDEEGDAQAGRRSIREIHASLVEPVCFGTEIEHWSRCATVAPTSSNGIDILKQLGPRIGAQLMEPRSFLDDDQGAWKLFGIRCRCKHTYKSELLCKSRSPNRTGCNSCAQIANLC
jgi:hypothetical protein